MTAAGSVIGELRVLKGRDLQLALAMTAMGNAGVLMVFIYLAPCLTEIGGFSPGTIPMLLLVYGVGATLGNLVGGWLSDRALMPSIIGLLIALAISLAMFQFVARFQVPAAVMVFAIGALAFSIIPGMQTRVLVTATAAPTLGIALNASGFQISAAFAAWLGGVVIDNGPGLNFLALVAALLTAIGVLVAFISWMRDS